MSAPPRAPRVAFIIQRFLPFVGGAELQLAAVAARLVKRGIEVCIFTRRHDDSATRQVIQDIPIHRIDLPAGRVAASLLFSLRAIPAIRQFRPDVVHAHELLSPTTTALAYKAMYGVPVIAKVLRGGTWGDIAKLKETPVGRLRLSMICRQVDAFAVISQEIDDELAGLGVPAARRKMAPNGVDTAIYAPPSAAERGMLRRELLQTIDDKPTALFAGRLEPEKQIDQLVAMWPKVREAVPGATLVVLGEGSMEASLRKAAAEGVVIAGPSNEMARWYKTADLFLLPSAAEGLSNALLEAMASGLVPVATAVGGAPEIIGEGRNGFLLPPEKLGEMPARIIEAFRAVSADPALSQEARQTVLEKFDLATTVSRLETLYRDMVAIRSRL